MPKHSTPDDDPTVAELVEDTKKLVAAAASGNPQWINEILQKICERGDNAILAAISGLAAVAATELAPELGGGERDPNYMYTFEFIDNQTDKVVDVDSLPPEEHAEVMVARLVTAYCNGDAVMFRDIVQAAYQADRPEFLAALVAHVGDIGRKRVRERLAGRTVRRCPLCECPDDPSTLPTGGFSEGPPGPLGRPTYTPHHSWCTQRKDH